MMYGWSEMGDYGAAHWLFFIIFIIAIAYPIGRILRRLGFSPFWSLLAFIPMINLIALWMLALIEWPSEGTSHPGHVPSV